MDVKNHKCFLNTENFANSLNCSKLYCSVDELMFQQPWTSLRFGVLDQHVVEKMHFTGWSQVTDTTVSGCIMLQSLYQTVLWLQIFSIPEDCFNHVTFIILNYCISGFHQSPVFSHWPSRSCMPLKEVFWCLVPQEPTDLRTASPAEAEQKAQRVVDGTPVAR